jgi:hypothetical protein
MRLDPKKVRFVTPFTALGLLGDAVRFVRGPKTVQLQETALVVEGNILKVGLLGLEVLFRGALIEWSSVTIPYARITRVKFRRFPLSRKLALLVFPLWVLMVLLSARGGFGPALEVGLLGLIPVFLALYVFLRVSPRFVLDFRAKSGRRTTLLFHVTDRKLRNAFAAKLAEYREAATRHALPDPEPPPRRSRGERIALWAGGLLVAAVAGLVTMYLIGEAVERFDPQAIKVKTKGP